MTTNLFRLLLAALAAAVLAGCASDKGTANTLFDLGPAMPSAAPQAGAMPPMPTLVVTDATGSASFDSERMFYRLNYSEPLEARTYANSRWNANPIQMVTQRLKTRIAQSGAKVLSTTDAAGGVPILRVDLEDFTHAFTSASQSEGRVTVRASLFREHKLVDQRTFNRSTPATSADAAGGARALAASLDAISSDITTWLASLNQHQQ